MPPTPLFATRRPLTRISVGRLRSWSCEPPAVRWLSLLALLVPALLRPANDGIALRRISNALVAMPFCSICLASRVITDTATWSGVVGSREPVTVMASRAVGSAPAAPSLACAPPGLSGSAPRLDIDSPIDRAAEAAAMRLIYLFIVIVSLVQPRATLLREY